MLSVTQPQGSRDYNFQTFLGGKKKEKRNALSTVVRTRPRTMEFDSTIKEISKEFGLLGICLKSLAVKVQF